MRSVTWKARMDSRTWSTGEECQCPWRVRAEDVRALYRNPEGFTQAVRVSDIEGIPDFLNAGASLGHLWMEGRFGMGDPLVNAGAPVNGRVRSCV